VLARASVAMSARPNLVVERAVDLVGLSAENAGEIVRHDRLREVWSWESCGVKVI
jgi:hypothetical protein